jgi:hypothetical protein
MTVRDIKKLIEDVPDDFLFEVEVSKRIPSDVLIKMQYPYPFEFERCQINGYDIGWSENRMKVNVRIEQLE